MKKVIVIGCPGAGKSTFARSLHRKTGFPLVHLDMLWHKKDKTHIDRAEFDALLSEQLSKGEWIIDGNYGRTLPARLQACDTVFLLDFPLEVCLEGARARVGKPRDDMPWIEETFDEEFEKFIRNFAKEQLPQIYFLLKKYPKAQKQVFVFKSRREAQAYLDSL